MRNGLNFTERGFGVRGAVGVSDRGHTAASQLKPGDVDWEQIFGRDGARWLHCGGIFAALSETTADVALEAMEAARRHGTVVSYDLNYRPSLWKSIGGPARAAEVNRGSSSTSTCCSGTRRTSPPRSGSRSRASTRTCLHLDLDAYARRSSRCWPRTRASRWSRRRSARCAARRSTTGRPWVERATASTSADATRRSRSSTASAAATRSRPGCSTGCSAGWEVDKALAYGVAHGALAMTTPGDTSMATLAEVEALVGGSSGPRATMKTVGLS